VIVLLNVFNCMHLKAKYSAYLYMFSEKKITQQNIISLNMHLRYYAVAFSGIYLFIAQDGKERLTSL